MGAKGSSLGGENKIDAEALQMYFKQVGETRELQPGNVLITQGQPSESVFLLVEGETTLKKYNETGEGKDIGKIIGTRGSGQILGELSFLLGTLPAVSVEVSGESTLTVIEAKQSALLELLTKEPEVAGNVFRLLGIIVGDRIAGTSASMKSSLINSSTQTSGATSSNKTTSALDVPPAEIAKKFGIDSSSEFIMHTDCTLSIEENSVSKGHDHGAIIFLFATHLCIEVSAFGFTNLRAIPLPDVLSLLPDKEPGEKSTKPTRVLQVQCKSFSLSLALGVNIYDSFLQECENARISAMDLSGVNSSEQSATTLRTPKGSNAKKALKVENGVMEQMQGGAQEKGKGKAASVLGPLSQEHWTTLLSGADQLNYKKNEFVIKEGDTSRALYQIVSGTLRVELKVKGRPQAVVVARRRAGEMFGERTLLLGGVAGASIVVDSDTAVLIRLTEAYLNKLFKSNPELPGKFYCFLATDQAGRLQKLTEEFDSGELVLPPGSKAPSDIETLINTAAYLSIMQKYVSKRDDAVEFVPQLEFIAEHKLFFEEADPKQLIAHGAQIYGKYMHANGTHQLSCISAKMRQELANEVKNTKLPTAKYRMIYEVAVATVIKSIENTVLQGFLKSSDYSYVLSLKLKETQKQSMEQFMALRVLGEGGFGQVLEVVKRDSGKHYAMKIMKKHELISAFKADIWKETVLLERRLQGNLHHPLLVNLAYSFQNIQYLVLVMDACPGGDLSVFALTSERLTPPQVKFVGQETVAVLAFLHQKFVLYRDLKPENLLLDAEGHVRLIDFGLALQGDGKMPNSMEHCGTPCYMAPEVKSASRKKKEYTHPADWYTLGVLMYELTEQNLPFGDDPRFVNARNEYRAPAMVNEKGQRDDQLHDMVLRLLDWSPEKRLGSGPDGGAQIKAHKYWGDVEWPLVDARKIPSPLQSYVQNRSGPRPDKLRKQQRAAVDTAVNMAKAEYAGSQQSAAGQSRTDLDVEGWDFVSSHAINQEYVESQTTNASIV
uniref:cGMP-dependent protein kinase n=1 Tax=Haptolina ericina TaxID=156174 RepID=A0A7S3BPB6_9EUKA|mmetsp:Transcript_62928/g.140109  ORF Transcript_62928/g.140109 Transcript_62928/m.140109 type:complete len:1003 (+) Transcript_62928:58-3066(+)